MKIIRVPKPRKPGTGCEAMYQVMESKRPGMRRVPPGKYQANEIPNPRAHGGDPWLTVTVDGELVGQPEAAWKSHGAKVMDPEESS